MEILKGVFKKSIFIILPAAVLSAFLFEPRKFPLGILMGWLFGIINLRQLSRNIEGLVGTEKMTLKLVFLSMIRLLVLFTAIFLLIYYRVVNVFGLLIGFTVVFILILVEGAKVGKRS
ncbi:MAG: ATP synthase subunit I [Nitrospirae bacterium]|nr:ATP synthase subunit I [Nitrospirota bacterium]